MDLRSTQLMQTKDSSSQLNLTYVNSIQIKLTHLNSTQVNSSQITLGSVIKHETFIVNIFQVNFIGLGYVKQKKIGIFS